MTEKISGKAPLLEAQDWTYPCPIAYGPGRIIELGKRCRDLGSTNPLVVTDRGSAELPFMKSLSESLVDAGLDFAVFDQIAPNPLDSDIANGRSVYRAGGHDGVIAIGGGSGMDGGKGIALVAMNDHDILDFNYLLEIPRMSKEDFPPLICIPTTAGTGAETESTAMITDTKRLMKWCVFHDNLTPSLALLDPELTLSLPANLTAWTGVDAMVHAIEAYAVDTVHPLCDGAALQALKLIGTHLPTAYAHPDNLEARGGMLIGSCLAGVSFMKGLGLVHAISHMVGAEFDTQHGLTNAVILPSVLRFNAPAMQSKMADLAFALGLDDHSFDAVYHHVCGLLDRLEIPKTLADIGVPMDCADRIARKAFEDSAASTNPRDITVADIAKVTQESLTLGR